MPWRALCRVELPVWDGDNITDFVVKQKGDTITEDEMSAAKQSEEDVSNLVDGGSIQVVE